MATESTLPAQMGLDLIRRLVANDVIGGRVTRCIIDAKANDILQITVQHYGDKRTIDATVDVLCGVTTEGAEANKPDPFISRVAQPGSTCSDCEHVDQDGPGPCPTNPEGREDMAVHGRNCDRFSRLAKQETGEPAKPPAPDGMRLIGTCKTCRSHLDCRLREIKSEPTEPFGCWQWELSSWSKPQEPPQDAAEEPAKPTDPRRCPGCEAWKHLDGTNYSVCFDRGSPRCGSSDPDQSCDRWRARPQDAQDAAIEPADATQGAETPSDTHEDGIVDYRADSPSGRRLLSIRWQVVGLDMNSLDWDALATYVAVGHPSPRATSPESGTGDCGGGEKPTCPGCPVYELCNVDASVCSRLHPDLANETTTRGAKPPETETGVGEDSKGGVVLIAHPTPEASQKRPICGCPREGGDHRPDVFLVCTSSALLEARQEISRLTEAWQKLERQHPTVAKEVKTFGIGYLDAAAKMVEQAEARVKVGEDAWRKLRKYMRARVSSPTPDFIVNMMDSTLTLDPSEATEAAVSDESNADSCGGCHQRDEFAAGRRSLTLRAVRDLLRAHGYLGHEGVQHVRLLFANDARAQANQLVDLLAAEESEATDGQD